MSDRSNFRIAFAATDLKQMILSQMEFIRKQDLDFQVKKGHLDCCEWFLKQVEALE